MRAQKGMGNLDIYFFFINICCVFVPILQADMKNVLRNRSGIISLT